MSFKNALRNLVAHFGTVWSLLLYIVIFAAMISGLSLPFLLPIARAFGNAGVFTEIRDAFSGLFEIGGWQRLWDGLYGAYMSVVEVFESNDTIVSLTMSFLIFVAIVAFRFFLGLYEIPLAAVVDGRMSCNAAYGLGGKFFSTLFVSIGYSAAKMLVTILYDAVMFGIVYGVCVAIGMNMFLPFAVILVLMLLMSLRYAIVACWAPSVVDGYGVVKGFIRSVRICFKRFGSIYSTYLMSVILLTAVGAFITLFTLGVGLIIVLPFSATYMCYLNATVYFNKTGKRYYVDGAVFVPPADNALQ